MTTQQATTPRTLAEKRESYAAYLARKAATAPDSGTVHISAAEAADIARLLRAEH